MYVVRRAFRGPHGPAAVGSIIEPTDIRMFKYHLQEKHIVEVNEQNLEKYAVLFKDRFGLDLKTIVANEEAVKAEEALKLDLIARCETLQLDLPEDLTIEQVIEAVEKAEEEAKAKAEEEAKAKAEEEAKAKAEEEAKAKAAEEAKAKAAEEAKAKVTPVVKPATKVTTAK